MLIIPEFPIASAIMAHIIKGIHIGSMFTMVFKNPGIASRAPEFEDEEDANP